MINSEMEQQPNSFRKMLAAAVSTTLLENGFDSVETECLGTLTEMMQAFITETASLSKTYTELSGRVEPLLGDIVLSFVEMGFNFHSLESYIKSSKHIVLPALQQQQPQKQLNMLAAGSKQPLSSHIPQHFPPFPDPHAYVRTPTHKQPIIDYESVREKAAVQKRDIEKALTKFLSKTNPTHNIFDTDEANIFPYNLFVYPSVKTELSTVAKPKTQLVCALNFKILPKTIQEIEEVTMVIACKPTTPAYLSALLPQDQIFDPEDLDIDPKSQILQQQKNHDKAKHHIKTEIKTEEDKAEALNESRTSDDAAGNPSFIDNPYLAATKLPGGEIMEIS